MMLNKAGKEIRVVLLVDEGDLRLWQKWCLEDIINIDHVKVVGVINNSSKYNRSNFLRKFKHKLLPEAMKVTIPPPWLSVIPTYTCNDVKVGRKYRFGRKCIDWVKELDPTVVLRFGFGFIDGEILEVPVEGVWSFHHGDIEQYRGRPPLFWEILHNEKRVGITLQRLNDVLDGGEILDRGFVALVPGFPIKTLQRLYECGPLLLRRTLINFSHSAPVKAVIPQRLGKLYRMPQKPEVAKFLIYVLLGYAKWMIEKSFLEYRWKIGSTEIDGKFSGDYSLCPDWVAGPPRGFYADPASSREFPDTVFLERYDNRASKGKIVAVTLDSGRALDNSAKEVLDLDRHLSFPQIYSVDGESWLIPETASFGKQLAFQLGPDLKITNAESPMEIAGLSGVDPVIFFRDGVWWALTSPGGESGSHLLNLFYSERLLGPYSPHIANPVVIDPRGARPAGSMYLYDGEIFRFGQVFGRRYGEGIEVFRITKIDKKSYQEERIASIRLKRGSNRPIGIHGIAIMPNSVVVDGYELRFSFLAGLRRVKNRVRARMR